MSQNRRRLSPAATGLLVVGLAVIVSIGGVVALDLASRDYRASQPDESSAASPSPTPSPEAPSEIAAPVEPERTPILPPTSTEELEPMPALSSLSAEAAAERLQTLYPGVRVEFEDPYGRTTALRPGLTVVASEPTAGGTVNALGQVTLLVE